MFVYLVYFCLILTMIHIVKVVVFINLFLLVSYSKLYHVGFGTHQRFGEAFVMKVSLCRQKVSCHLHTL